MKYLIIAVVLLSGCVSVKECRRDVDEAFVLGGRIGAMNAREDCNTDRLKNLIDSLKGICP